MKILNVKQGDQAWHEARAKYRTASAAPAMMGVGKMSRSALLKACAEGIEVEHSQYTEEVVFARGHEVEALARPIAEKLVGDDLFPATGVCDDDYLLASFDGLTMDDRIIWECKQFNQTKAGSVSNGLCPEEDYWQVVHQLKVSGAEKCLYTVTDGTDENTLALEIYPNEDDFKALMAGWHQFEQDIAEYQPREDAPEVAGRAPDKLPALHIEVKGAVTASNLDAFKENALAVFKGINTDLNTDADFANAEKTAKWCKDVEGKLDSAKEHALAQTASIDELFRAIDSIKEEARAKRLDLERSVKARKESIRREIVSDAREALAAHVSKVNASLPYPIPAPPADFAAAIKGKRTVSSLRDAADDLLAQSKIAANDLADRVRVNAKIITDAGHPQLFADAGQLCMKDQDHVESVVKVRIAEHEQAEQRRVEADRERIRREEQARVDREANERQKHEHYVNPPKARPEESKGHTPQTVSVKQPAKPDRPSDIDILSVLADHYRVNESKAHEWIIAMDHKALEKWIRDEFAA